MLGALTRLKTVADTRHLGQRGPRLDGALIFILVVWIMIANLAVREKDSEPVADDEEASPVEKL